MFRRIKRWSIELVEVLCCVYRDQHVSWNDPTEALH